MMRDRDGKPADSRPPDEEGDLLFAFVRQVIRHRLWQKDMMRRIGELHEDGRSVKSE